MSYPTWVNIKGKHDNLGVKTSMYYKTCLEQIMWQEHWRYSGALGVFWGKVLRVFEGICQGRWGYILGNWGSLRGEGGWGVECGSVEFFWVRDILGGIVDILRRARYWGSLRGEGWIGEDQSQPWSEPPPRPHTSVQSVHSSDEDVIVGKRRRQVCAIYLHMETHILFLHFPVKIDM